MSRSLPPTFVISGRRSAHADPDETTTVRALPPACFAMAEHTCAEFGRIDVLVNNAGIYRAALPLGITEEHWDAVMNVNAKAVFFASQAVPIGPNASRIVS
jgi:NAD(P)-dependent dehydrogenase (short-subunit alcohol dehydrogenase family)